MEIETKAQSSSDIQLWVVVCTEYHGAFGPFSVRDTALAFAKEQTASDKGNCVYVPVPLTLGPGAETRRIETEDSGSGHSGQYL